MNMHVIMLSIWVIPCRRWFVWCLSTYTTNANFTCLFIWAKIFRNNVLWNSELTGKIFTSVQNIVCNASMQIYWSMGLYRVGGWMNNKTRLVRTWPINHDVGIKNLKPGLLWLKSGSLRENESVFNQTLDIFMSFLLLFLSVIFNPRMCLFMAVRAAMVARVSLEQSYCWPSAKEIRLKPMDRIIIISICILRKSKIGSKSDT